MNHHYTHVNFGFEVAEVQHAVEGAIDTILGFDRSIANLEIKLKELLPLMETCAGEQNPVFAIYRVLADLRFHMEEAEEYRDILHRLVPPKQRATS